MVSSDMGCRCLNGNTFASAGHLSLKAWKVCAGSECERLVSTPCWSRAPCVCADPVTPAWPLRICRREVRRILPVSRVEDLFSQETFGLLAVWRLILVYSPEMGAISVQFVWRLIRSDYWEWCDRWDGLLLLYALVRFYGFESWFLWFCRYIWVFMHL